MNLIIKSGQLHIYYHNRIVAVHQITNNKLNILEQHNLKYDIKEDTNKRNEIIMNEMRNIRYD